MIEIESAQIIHHQQPLLGIGHHRHGSAPTRAWSYGLIADPFATTKSNVAIRSTPANVTAHSECPSAATPPGSDRFS